MSGEQVIKLLNILLVEDNVADVEIFQRALQASNIAHKLKVINDGEEALEFLVQFGDASDQTEIFQPQLIILDLNLPKVTGFEILKAVKFNCKTSAVPVMMLTTSDDGEDIEMSYKLGASSFVTKPVSPQEFTMLVAEIEKYWANTYS